MFNPTDPIRHQAPTSLRAARGTTPRRMPSNTLRVSNARDRVALGYYDQPAMTEALVTRLIQSLSAERN
ncbi:MAG: hypothetical protein V3V20_00525 [Algisphaera sp.]